jgi:hypothetical protein
MYIYMYELDGKNRTRGVWSREQEEISVLLGNEMQKWDEISF